MKSKVTLKEIVGTKIIYAALLVCYYWMWARRDWHNYYDSIQNSVFIFTIGPAPGRSRDAPSRRSAGR